MKVTMTSIGNPTMCNTTVEGGETAGVANLDPARNGRGNTTRENRTNIEEWLRSEITELIVKTIIVK